MSYGKLQTTILEILPDFCWVSAFDVLLMLEQIDVLEDTSHNTLRGTLLRLFERGLVTRKLTQTHKHRRGTRKEYLYLLVKN